MREVKRPTIDVKENWIDRLVEAVNPVAARERRMARMQLALSGGFVGGKRDRRATKEYNPSALSADADILPDLPTLRARSRDMARNAPLALGAINSTVTSVVGTGLALKSIIDAKALGMTDEQAADWQEMAEREFELWASSPFCDATRTHNFYQLQELAFRAELESGDVCALLPMIRGRAGAIYETAVQLVEADRLCNPQNATDKPTLAGGVEMDAYGAPVKYHFLKQHPGSYYAGASREWVPVPAFGAKTGRRNVVHLFRRLRPGQTRGYPYLSPVIEPLKQLDRYTEAEVTAAVVSAMFTVFVKQDAGGGDGLDVGAGKSQSAAGGEIALGAGAIIDLNHGESVEFADPKRPNTAFDPFVQAVLRQVGVALELPFEVLVKHYTASYSAARAALLDAWRFWRGRRAHLGAGFCQPIYEAVLEEAIAKGRLSAPGFFDNTAVRRAYCGAEWHGDAPGQIDPTKEVEAAQKRIDGLFSTHAKETMELTGMHWRDVIRQRAKENKEMAAVGMKPASPPAAPPAPGAGNQPPPPDDETDDGPQPPEDDAGDDMETPDNGPAR